MKKVSGYSYEKLSDEKVLVKEKVPYEIPTLTATGGMGRKTVMVDVPVEEVEMNEKWRNDELIALRSTVNVALNTANGAIAECGKVESKLLQPLTGKDLWTVINETDAKIGVSSSNRNQKIVELEQKLVEQQEQIDKLLDLVQSLIETKEKEDNDDSEMVKSLRKILKDANPPRVPVGPSPYGSGSTFFGPMKPYKTTPNTPPSSVEIQC